MLIRWRVYHRPTRAEALRSAKAKRRHRNNPHLATVEVGGAVYLRSIDADCQAAALFLAKQRYHQYKCVSVVAELSWSAMTPFERSVFLGTFVPPQESEQTTEGRKSVCQKCGRAIFRLLPDGQARWGRPPKYHDECAPDRVKRDRLRGGVRPVPQMWEQMTLQVA